MYRQELARNPDSAMAWVKVAVTLQEMNHNNPDGGRRVIEAVHAYTWATRSPPA